MNKKKIVILITGSTASGKTTLMEKLSKSEMKWWKICGFTSPSSPRSHKSEIHAAFYELSIIGHSEKLPWALRNQENSGFEFCEQSRIETNNIVRSCLDQKSAEICFLDEIGLLEVQEQGFADLLRHTLSSASCGIVVASVAKKVLHDVIQKFDISNSIIVDLDKTSQKEAEKLIRSRFAKSDKREIGLFAGVAGLVEVGIGSTLHAYRIPFKGHMLMSLQNLLLITFGKALNGRGLLRISLISSMLKAFSPVGARFKPMAYIFLQGSLFSAPVHIMGWGFVPVLIGSILMAWITLILSLSIDYLTFGKSIFDAYSGAINLAGSWLGIQKLSLQSVLFGAFILKGLASLVVAFAGYYLNMESLVRRLLQRGFEKKSRSCNSTLFSQKSRCSIFRSAFDALMDVARPGFAATFILSALLLLFFTDLSKSDFVSVLIRGLSISYLGFVVFRQVDFTIFGKWLDRRAGLDLGESIQIAIGFLDNNPEKVLKKHSVDEYEQNYGETDTQKSKS